ncbi:hypothetical protein [Brevundimonas sp.]|uniref:hypothetical protein n=1 Tax=Brevundimonas sp. TaxID=1871086 RepID=UPI0011FF58FB|nr:hypothetical protein [Brevundimonas sp.]TAJ60676.1 MAG: hypothetical protein EPO49_09145 [Brevundimonas sp.]
MRRLFGGFVLALLACGCTAKEASTVRSEADTATLMASTTHVWMANFDGDRGGLAYFVPETDALVVSLECVRNSGRATIAALTEEQPGHGTLVLWDGDRANEWPAEVEWDDAMGGSLAVAEVNLSDAALRPLREGQGIRISRPAIGPLNVASAPERREVERFFAFCDR